MPIKAAAARTCQPARFRAQSTKAHVTWLARSPRPRPTRPFGVASSFSGTRLFGIILDAGDLAVMGPGEIFATARNFKPTSDPFRIRDCLIGIIGRIKRLRVFLAIGTLPIPQAVAEPPHHGELHSS